MAPRTMSSMLGWVAAVIAIGVAVATQAGRDPEDVNLRDRQRRLGLSVRRRPCFPLGGKCGGQMGHSGYRPVAGME